MSNLTHLNKQGEAEMVDIGAKDVTGRVAEARATVHMSADAFAQLRDSTAKKGDVLAAARIAGIMAAKKTPELIPLCHQLQLTKVSVEFELDEASSAVEICASAQTSDRTGVEMEALTAASVAALTIYDMLKAVDRAMRISDLRVTKKSGGKSGDYRAD